MKTLLVAVLLAVTSSQPSGRLYLHVIPGLQVFVDGVAAGTTTAEEDGKILRDLAPGPHRVVVRAEDGRQTTLNVSITSGATSEVRISPLGFRKLNRPAVEDDTSALRIRAIPTESVVVLNGATRENHDATELTFDPIPAGKYPLIITHGGRSVRSDIELPKGSVVTADVSFDQSSIRVTDSRPRPRRLQLTEPNDALRFVNVPADWKTAIRTALPAGVSILDAWGAGDAVRVRLSVPSERVARALLGSLARSSAFADIEYGSEPRREKDGWIVDLVFTFAS